MASNYYRRLENIRSAIKEDLEPIVSREYDHILGLACVTAFNGIFEECWKLMRELLIEFYGYMNGDEAVGGPSNVIKTAYSVGLIRSNRWGKMLLDRNYTTHDYRNQNIEGYYRQVKDEYYKLILDFIAEVPAVIEKGILLNKEFEDTDKREE